MTRAGGKTFSVLGLVTLSAFGGALPYELVGPATQSREQALLIALPGAGESAKFYCDIFSAGRYRKLARERGYVLACLSSYGLGMRYEKHENQIIAVRDELIARYPRVRKVFLTGYSIGGRGALMIALRHPDKFDGVASIVPWLRLPGDNRETFPEMTARVEEYPHEVFFISARFDFFFPSGRKETKRFIEASDGRVNRKYYLTDHWFVVAASAKDMFDFFDHQRAERSALDHQRTDIKAKAESLR